MPQQEIEILESWDGPVMDPGYESYHDSLADALPTSSEFLIPCDKRRVPELNYDDVIEHYLESLEVDDYIEEYHLNGTRELRDAIEAFNRANDNLSYYETVDNKQIRVQPITTTED